MASKRFVVAVKRKMDFSGKPLFDDEQDWVYGQYDTKTHQPVFYDLRGAIYFKTAKQAKSWYDSNKEYFGFLTHYNVDTFEIQEVFVESVEKLEYEKPKYEISLMWG